MARRKTLDCHRARYLDAVKRIVVAAHSLQSMRDVELAVCMTVPPDEDDMERATVLQRELHNACEAMRRIEKDSRHRLGVGALTGSDLPDALRIAICILAGKCCTDAVQVTSVSALAELSAGHDAAGLLLVHEAMKKGGALRDYVSLDFLGARNLGEADPALTEAALERLFRLHASVEDIASLEMRSSLPNEKGDDDETH